MDRIYRIDRIGKHPIVILSILLILSIVKRSETWFSHNTLIVVHANTIVGRDDAFVGRDDAFVGRDESICTSVESICLQPSGKAVAHQRNQRLSEVGHDISCPYAPAYVQRAQRFRLLSALILLSEISGSTSSVLRTADFAEGVITLSRLSRLSALSVSAR